VIKYYCDRCGADMSRERVLGYISLNTKDKAEKELREDNEFEKWHFCKSCMHDIRRYVRANPVKTCEEPSQNEEKRDQNEEKRDQNEEKCGQNEEKRSEPAESGVKQPETVQDQNESKPQKRIDTGKIMALKKAGWRNKDIADEMHMTPNAVASAIYLYKKHHTEQNV